MNHTARILLILAGVTCGPSGCQWIGGIENTTVGGDAAPPERDAAPPAPDATPGDGAPSGADAAPAADAAPSRDICPIPCAGDAFGDFYNEQGGANGLWRYVEVQPERQAGPYVDMTMQFFPDAVLGWLGTGSPAPSIAFCAVPKPEPPCQELDDLLALTTTSNEPGAHHPALMWTAPTTGVYYMTGTWRVSSAAPMVETTMRITQNDEGIVLEEMPVTLTDTPFPFEIEIAASQGDRIVLSAVASEGVSVSVGVELFFQGPF
jgi:hypothetical protein